MTSHGEKAKASRKHHARGHCRGLRRAAAPNFDWTVGFFEELRRLRDRHHTRRSFQP